MENFDENYNPFLLFSKYTLLHTPSGLKYSQHFSQHNFSSRANLKTSKGTFDIYIECLIVISSKSYD